MLLFEILLAALQEPTNHRIKVMKNEDLTLIPRRKRAIQRGILFHKADTKGGREGSHVHEGHGNHRRVDGVEAG